jgi:virginiamycin B lyase
MFSVRTQSKSLWVSVPIRRPDPTGGSSMRFVFCSVCLAGLLCVFSGSAVAQSGAYSAITMYAVQTANSIPQGITLGPDRILWFTESGANKIAHFSGSGPITEYAVPTPSSGPNSITLGPDGALWFTEWDGNKIGRITTAGAIIEFDLPTANADPYGITVGPDGALWFVEVQPNVSRVGRITTSGVITEYPVSTPNSGGPPLGNNFGPLWIASGPDGALWFTDYEGDYIGRITTSGSVTEYPVPTADSAPGIITAGPDGALWFTENAGDKIGRITTTGAFTEYPLATPGSEPFGIVTGPDGALWFVEQAGDQIGRITTRGVITEFPGAGNKPELITSGPDHDLWFTVAYGNSIASAPACGLGLSASFAGNTLTTNFDLGIVQSGIWSVYAGDTVLLRKEIPPVVPPHQFSVSFGAFPNEGNVTITSALSVAGGQTLCSEWTTVSIE